MHEVPSGVATDRLSLVRESLARRVARLVSASRRVRAAADSEATHDLRVSARGLEVVLRTWERLFPTRPRKAAIRSLRRVRRRLRRARVLQVHVALLEPRVARHGDHAVRWMRRLADRLARCTARAADEVRGNRFRRLRRRLEEATADLESRLIAHPDAFARARARVIEAGVVAQAALRIACTQMGDRLLRRARIATKEWRYAIECVQEVVPLPEAQELPALREIEAVLGTFQDRATLIAAIERFARDQDRSDLRLLREELEAESQAAFHEFQGLAMALTAESVAPTARPNGALRVESVAATSTAESGTRPSTGEERWEHMARWLLAGTSKG